MNDVPVFIDTDSGTVFNGPVFFVEVPESDMDAILDNDEAARDYALSYGRPVA